MPESGVCAHGGSKDGDRGRVSGCTQILVRRTSWRAGKNSLGEFACLHMREHVYIRKKMSAVILTPFCGLHEFFL